jgi:hypothetical protein
VQHLETFAYDRGGVDVVDDARPECRSRDVTAIAIGVTKPRYSTGAGLTAGEAQLLDELLVRLARR